MDMYGGKMMGRPIEECGGGNCLFRGNGGRQKKRGCGKRVHGIG